MRDCVAPGLGLAKRHRGEMKLGFVGSLLGLGLSAGLAAGCSDDGLINQSTTAAADTGTTGGTTRGTAATSSQGSDTQGTTTDEPGGDTSTSTSTSSTGVPTSATEGSGSGSSSSSSSGSSESSDSSSGGGNQACADGCAVEFMCGMEWMSEEECVTWCEANLEKAYAFSPFCHDAWEGVSACLGTLTCEEFAEWDNPMVFPYPCSDADTILAVECKGQ